MAKGRGARCAWRAGFLRALRERGSVKLAAEAAGVDKTTAYARRKRDAAFAAEWAAALVAARDALAVGASAADRGPALAADEVVRASRHGRPCVLRAGPGRWSAGAEDRFLRALATDCNVKRAAAAAGVSAVAVYKRRQEWPGFAERWAAALDQGYARLECLLVEQATAVLDGGARAEDGGEDGAMEGGARPSFQEAFNLFRLHRYGATGEGRRPRHDWRKREPTIEEVRAEVLRRVRAMGG